MDIGAFHPRWASNTHLLHKRGFEGICVDLDERRLKWFRFAKKMNPEAKKTYLGEAAAAFRLRLCKKVSRSLGHDPDRSK